MPTATVPPTSEFDQWLREIRAMTGLSQLQAMEVFAAVCRELASQLPSSDTSGLMDQLPAAARQHMDTQRSGAIGQRDFIADVCESCPTVGPHQVKRAIWAVLTMLSHHLSPLFVRHIRNLLPKEVQAMWNTAA